MGALHGYRLYPTMIWWSSLSVSAQVFYGIAAIASLIDSTLYKLRFLS